MQTLLPIAGWCTMQYRPPRGFRQRTHVLRNAVTTQGVNYLLDSSLRGGTQAPALYGGLIDNAGYLGVDAADRHDSHPGWSEMTALLSAFRPLWLAPPANGGLLGTLVACQFHFSADAVLKGSFLSTIATVGSVAAGTLYNTAIAGTPLSVEAGGFLDVTFAIRLGE